MAKYAEVFKKQRDVEAVEERGHGNRNNWVGFTFGKNHVSYLELVSLCVGLMKGRAGQDRGQARRRGIADYVLSTPRDSSRRFVITIRVVLFRPTVFFPAPFRSSLFVSLLIPPYSTGHS
jgi:hypothetical protein